MGLLNYDPVSFGHLHSMNQSDHIALPLAIDGLAGVALVPQDFGDHPRHPAVFLVDAGPVVPGTPVPPLIHHGRRNALRIENRGNLFGAVFFCCQAKDAPDHLCRFRICQEAVFVLRVFHKSIGSKRAEKQPLCRPLAFCVLDLGGKFPAVQVIDQGFERGIQAVDVRLPGAVKTIVDGNKPDAEERKNPADIVSNGQIVASKSGQVFHQDALDLACFDLLHHAGEIRPLKILSAPAVITEFQHVSAGKLRVAADIVRQQPALVGNALGLFLSGILEIIILTGYAKIHGNGHTAALPSR